MRVSGGKHQVTCPAQLGMCRSLPTAFLLCSPIGLQVYQCTLRQAGVGVHPVSEHQQRHLHIQSGGGIAVSARRWSIGSTALHETLGKGHAAANRCINAMQGQRVADSRDVVHAVVSHSPCSRWQHLEMEVGAACRCQAAKCPQQC